MAVAIVMEFEGTSLDAYDKVNSLMGLTPGGAGPEGSISHWATMTEKGLQVTDVWESREKFDAFARDKLAPLSAEAGFGGPPTMTFHEVHNYFTAGSGA